MSLLSIDPGSSVPVFAQLRQQIVDQRLDGRLPAGYRLPPVRQLAQSLGLAPNTVARAYRQLEMAGVIETRGRLGSFVTGTRDSVDKAVRALAREYLVAASQLGVSKAEAVLLVEQESAEGVAATSS